MKFTSDDLGGPPHRQRGGRGAGPRGEQGSQSHLSEEWFGMCLMLSVDNPIFGEFFNIVISVPKWPEVNISPKISISAQPLKMALHRNPAMHGSRMVIFLHDSKKALF